MRTKVDLSENNLGEHGTKVMGNLLFLGNARDMQLSAKEVIEVVTKFSKLLQEAGFEAVNICTGPLFEVTKTVSHTMQVLQDETLYKKLLDEHGCVCGHCDDKTEC